MKICIVLLLAAACTPAATRRSVDPQALRGVALGIPSPADARDSPGIGCGQVSQDLPLRAHKLLVAAFSDAGAQVSNASTGSAVLTVALREAEMGPENVRPRRTDKPVEITQPDAPPIDQPQQRDEERGVRYHSFGSVGRVGQPPSYGPAASAARSARCCSSPTSSCLLYP